MKLRSMLRRALVALRRGQDGRQSVHKTETRLGVRLLRRVFKW